MIYTHRPLVWITIFYGLGIAMSQIIPMSFAWLCFLSMLSFIMSIVVLKKSTLSVAALLVTFILLGATYTQSRMMPAKNHIAGVVKFYRHQPFIVKGVIVSDVQKRNFGRGRNSTFTLRIKMLKTPYGWQEKSGEILVNAFRDIDCVYGDYILIEGKLHQPYNFSTNEHFSYGDYLRNKGIYSILSVKKDAPIEILDSHRANFLLEGAIRFKNKLEFLLAQGLSPNEAGLMQAFLLGDRVNISPRLRDLFVQTGTAHILAISGMNVGVVAAVFLIFLKIIPLPRLVQFLITIFLLVGFCLLTGASPSVVRATIMAIVFLISFMLEREGDSLNTLSLAALIILLINPLNLFDVGFQLSFVCVLSIILFYPIFKSLFDKPPKTEHKSLLRPCIESICLSMAVWLGVVGLIAFYFNIVTPVTILANLIVVPLSSLLIILGLSLMLVGAIFPMWILPISACIKLTLNILVGSIYLFAKIPMAYFYIKNVNLWLLAGYYIILISVLYFLYHKRSIFYEGDSKLYLGQIN